MPTYHTTLSKKSGKLGYANDVHEIVSYLLTDHHTARVKGVGS